MPSRRTLCSATRRSAVGMGKGAEQERLADAEDRRRRADPECENDDGGRDEAAVASKVAQAAAQILVQRVHRGRRRRGVPIVIVSVRSHNRRHW